MAMKLSRRRNSPLVSWHSVVAPSRIHVFEATALDTLVFARNKDPGDSAEMDKSSAYSPLAGTRYLLT
jgi:hypothetical protein